MMTIVNMIHVHVVLWEMGMTSKYYLRMRDQKHSRKLKKKNRLENISLHLHAGFLFKI